MTSSLICVSVPVLIESAVSSPKPNFSPRGKFQLVLLLSLLLLFSVTNDLLSDISSLERLPSSRSPKASKSPRSTRSQRHVQRMQRSQIPRGAANSTSGHGNGNSTESDSSLESPMPIQAHTRSMSQCNTSSSNCSSANSSTTTTKDDTLSASLDRANVASMSSRFSSGDELSNTHISNNSGSARGFLRAFSAVPAFSSRVQQPSTPIRSANSGGENTPTSAEVAEIMGSGSKSRSTSACFSRNNTLPVEPHRKAGAQDDDAHSFNAEGKCPACHSLQYQHQHWCRCGRCGINGKSRDYFNTNRVHETGRNSDSNSTFAGAGAGAIASVISNMNSDNTGRCSRRCYYYGLITVGAFAAHTYGFRRGGVLQLQDEIASLEKEVQGVKLRERSLLTANDVQRSLEDLRWEVKRRREISFR